MPIFVAAAAAVLACSCASPRTTAQPQPPSAAAAPARDLAELIRLYQTDSDGVSRFYDLPWSPARFDRMQALYASWQDRLAHQDFAALDQQGKIDFILLRAHLRSELAHLDLDRRRLSEMEPLLPFREAIQDLELGEWKLERADPEAAAARIAAIPDQIKKLRERIKKEDGKKDEPKKPEAGKEDTKTAAAPPPATDPSAPILISPVTARRAASAVNEIRGTLNDWYGFGAGYQPEFTWWLKKPYEEAGAALDDYARFLREDIAGLKGKDDDPLIGDPIGRDALLADLRTEMIPYPPERLIRIGERELAWCESEMKKASHDMGLGDDWKAALAKVKADHVPPGHQDELVADQAKFVIDYLTKNDLVTIPDLCRETWRLRMIPPSVQRSLPFAYYGGQHMAVAYPTEDMKQDDKEMSMRGNNRHFTRIVTPHELIPGHHLQGFMAQRIRPYRQMFSTPFLVEGWAVYWEMTLWELGYPQTPEDRIGMLFWRAHRAARIIVSLKFHLGQMTPPEMIDFLVDHVGHERFGATSEVRRYIGGDYSPLYQCGYMIGALQFRAMRRELVDSGKMTNKQFHDTILTYGPIPVELIRDGMENLPLTPEYEAQWNFDER